MPCRGRQKKNDSRVVRDFPSEANRLYRALKPMGKKVLRPKENLLQDDKKGEEGDKQVSLQPYHVRNMLRTYGRQVTTGRRLARYRRSLRAAEAEDDISLSKAAKRHDLVQRVAAEVVENLLVTGSESPVVDEILATLEDEFGHQFLFAYPPEEQDLQIFILEDNGDAHEVSPEDKAQILNRVWQIALIKVDETML